MWSSGWWLFVLVWLVGWSVLLLGVVNEFCWLVLLVGVVGWLVGVVAWYG